jgi:hypothetical protein
MFLLLLLVILPLLALVVFDLAAWRWGTDSRDWRSAGEWRWQRRRPASTASTLSDGTLYDN